MLVIPPGVAHTGAAETPAGWTYRVFYPKPQSLLELQTQVLRRSSDGLSLLPLCQIQDPELRTHLIAAHRAFETGAGRLECQSRMLSAFSRLLSRLVAAEALPPGLEASAVKRARDYLEEHFADDIGIDELAGVAGLSASHLMRCFTRQIGTSMHSYLIRVRLRHARELLIRGESAAIVACAVGFVDQSHLIRRFRNTYGATPGSYVRETREHW